MTALEVLRAIFAAVHTPVAPPPPPPPLPSLPSVARVAVEVAKDHLVVIEEIDLPRGTWRGGDLDLFVAFGAPGAPVAFDAHLVPVADGALEPSPDVAGESIAFDRAARRPGSAHAFLGPGQMAGAVLHVKESMLTRAFAPGNMAAVRTRTLVPLPAVDAGGAREIVVRLGVASGTPLTLGRLQLTSREPTGYVRSADARLCGPDADAYPLAIAVSPHASVQPVSGASASSPSPSATSTSPPSPGEGSGGASSVRPRPIAPVLAVRHATDDLCVRFVAGSPP